MGPEHLVGVSAAEQRARAADEYVRSLSLTKDYRGVARRAFLAGWDARGGDSS